MAVKGHFSAKKSAVLPPVCQGYGGHGGGIGLSWGIDHTHRSFIVYKEAITTHIAAITKGTNATKVSSGITSYINDTINKGMNAILAQNKANKQLRLV